MANLRPGKSKNKDADPKIAKPDADDVPTAGQEEERHGDADEQGFGVERDAAGRSIERQPDHEPDRHDDEYDDLKNERCKNEQKSDNPLRCRIAQFLPSRRLVARASLSWLEADLGQQGELAAWRAAWAFWRFPATSLVLAVSLHRF